GLIGYIVMLTQGALPDYAVVRLFLTGILAGVGLLAVSAALVAANWAKGAGTLAGRIRDAAAVAAMVLFALWLHSWNLIGYRM
ncbi:MAG TPA: hypothetical protein P5287_03440, partial [bacterium]|nr:hypothetical protein [bacterium]